MVFENKPVAQEAKIHHLIPWPTVGPLMVTDTTIIIIIVFFSSRDITGALHATGVCIAVTEDCS